MRIDIWSDFNCPWCGIGRARLQQALAQVEPGTDVEVVYHPYLLMPQLPVGSSAPTVEILQKLKGFTDEQLAGFSQIEELGRQSGFSDYVLLKNRSGNATLAHEFVAFATSLGKGDEAIELVFKKYFESAHDIFSVDGLLDIAEWMGLDVEDTREVLMARKFQAQVSSELAQARQIGVDGVPFFVFNNKYAVSGAQPPETLLRIMEQAERDAPMRIQADSNVCGIDGCD